MTSQAFLSLNGFYNHQNGNDFPSGSNQWGTLFSYSKEGYHYLSNNKTFIEFSPSISFSYKDSHANTENSSYTNKTSLSELFTRLKFNIGIGKGRIEYVQDARQAVYILQGLNEKGLLKKTLSDEEVNAFAQQITRVKKKRQFDSRTKLIEEITTVDSFLVTNGYIDQTHSAPYFTTLYDDWMYAGLIGRKSGKRFTVGITPDYYFSQDIRKIDFEGMNNPNNNDYRFFGSGINGSLYIDYSYEKPINLYWQRSAGVNSNTSWGKVRHLDENIVYSYLSGFYGMGYYPNSRTSISGSLSEGLAWSEPSKSIQTSTSFNFSMYYYLSPQLIIKGEYYLSYSFARATDWGVNQYNKYPNNTFDITLTYSIF